MKFLISAGHGGTDPGACAHGHTEAAIALAMRDKVAARLLELRHTVFMDGGHGENQPLKQALALVKGTDLAVELHCNAATNFQACGVEVMAPSALKVDAQRIASALARETGQTLRGEAGYKPQAESHHKKLAFVQAGGIIVEMFFISHRPSLLAFLASQDRVALAIAGAMCSYQVAA
jgi:N-acetylmuramoyl-L-alanine amidase